MNAEAARIISSLGLAPLPREGGYFARTWTSGRLGPDGRALGSAILFMLTDADFSALHRIETDEIWLFHAGDPADLALLDPRTGLGRVLVLGADLEDGHVPQVVVPGGVWQGARIRPGAAGGRGWALFSCTLAPAWDEGEFVLGRGNELASAFPGQADIVRALTR